MTEKEIEHLYEVGVPEYLQKDIDALIEGSQQDPPVLHLDCLWGEVYGSINSALYSGEITEQQAEYLRNKYLHGKDI